MSDHGSAQMFPVRDDQDRITGWAAECSGGETFHGASLDEVDRAWCDHVNQVIPGANEKPMRNYGDRAHPTRKDSR